MHIVDDACLSQPRHNGGAMFVEAMHPVSIVDGVALCLSDVVFLGTEKSTLLIGLSHFALPILACYLKVFLPA